MKLLEQKGKAALIGGDTAEIHNVGISNDPRDQMMILNVLSNSLYTDKVSAVLREYGCNAADANVEAGRGKQPIEVRLPNRLDPTVAIRDFGAGMTPEQIVNTFIKLGASTKRNSNAFTGMLGIGSKAGFAYGDSFVVTSWTSGNKAVYNLFRDKGTLNLATLFAGPSDEPDGVEVKVPVRTEDMPEFLTKARVVFSYFAVRPIIHGAKLEWIKREEVFAGKGWRYTGNAQSVAIMGNVAYKLDAEAMGLERAARPGYGSGYNTYGAPSQESALLGAGVELDFRIGDLEIAASREGLQYNEPTKAALNAAMKQVLTEIGATFTSKIATSKSLWEAKLWFREKFDGGLDTNSGYLLKRIVAGTIKWGKHTITTSDMDIGNREGLLGMSVTSFTPGGRRYNSAPGAHRSYPGVESVTVASTVQLMINDLPTKKHSPARIKAWFLANPTCKNIIQFTYPDAKTEAAHWKNRELTGAPYVKLSSITPAAPTPSAGGAAYVHNSKHSTKVFFLDEAGSVDSYSACSLYWKAAEVDVKKDGGVYVPIDCFRIQGLGCGEHPSLFRDSIKKLRKAGLLAGQTQVYGFKPDRLGKLGPKWVKLEDHIKAVVALSEAKQNYAQEIVDALNAQHYTPLLPSESRTSYPVNSPLRKLLDEYHRMLNPTTASAGLRTLLYSGDCTPWLAKAPANTKKASFDLAAQEKLVLAKYPLLAHISRYELQCASGVRLKNVVDYITLVESN